MNKGHKRKSHEHRKDLVGEHRWGDTGQIILLVIFFIFLIFNRKLNVINVGHSCFFKIMSFVSFQFLTLLFFQNQSNHLLIYLYYLQDTLLLHIEVAIAKHLKLSNNLALVFLL